MLKSKISPSLMCADIINIKEILNELAKENVDYLHIDVMDGEFVPNLMLSNEIVKQFRKITNIPYDYHLMIKNPDHKIDWFDLRENDLMSIHYEAALDPKSVLEKIKSKGAKAGIALKPSTGIENVSYLLPDVDFILIMTVNPGFAGQKLIPETLAKIKSTRLFLNEKGYENIRIQVDGNVSFENAKKMRLMGADIFVGGTSSIFKKDLSISEGLALLREAIDGD